VKERKKESVENEKIIITNDLPPHAEYMNL